MQQEPAAADPRGVRLHDTQNHLDRDRGIDGRTAAAKHFESRFHRQRVSGRDHRLRRRLHRWYATDRDQQQRNAEQAANAHARRATMNRRRKGNSVMPSGRVG